MFDTTLKDEILGRVIGDLQEKSKAAGYKYDPVGWAEDVLGVFLWSGQKTLLRSLVDHKKTAMKSCHSVSKTFTSAVAVCWWVSTRPNSMVRSTAPTYYQVHELLWEEIRKFHAKHNLVGEINQKDEWKRPLYGTTALVGSGKKPSDTNIHAFHGVHRPDGVLVVLDEGCGVNQSLYTAADAISTGPHDRVLAVGNPDDPDTEFGRIFNTPEGQAAWNLLTISAFDTPNFTGEVVPEVVSRGLIQPKWVDERAVEWGEDSARYKSKILGEFPDQSSDAFFRQREIDRAYDLEIPLDTDAAAYGIMGVDVASSGGDHSVIALNRGGQIRVADSWVNGDIFDSIDRIFSFAERNGVKEIRIDAVGYGEAVAEAMKRDDRIANYVFVPIKGSYAPRDRAAHLNARAEQYDNLRIGMGQGRIDLDRLDEKVRDQLLAIKGFLTDKGAIKIESKQDMRARGVKSPDELDAIVYAAANFDYLFEPEKPKNTKIYQDADDFLGQNNSVLELMAHF